MAAITSNFPSLATPTGEARIRRGQAGVAIARGEAVAISGTPTSKMWETRYILAPTEATAVGIALNDAAAGAQVNVLIDGEIGGFADLTPGAQLSVVAGVLDDTAPAGASRRLIIAYNETTVQIS